MKYILTVVFLFSKIATADLYQDLMPIDLRNSHPKESEKSFKVHLLDSYKIFPEYVNLEKASLNEFNYDYKQTGKITYVSVVNKKYFYFVSNINNKLIINVKVHFTNATEKERISFRQKFQDAARFWNVHRIKYNFDYEFKFDVEDQPQNADFKVKLLDDTRGPYDTYWNRKWDERTVAHEIGHMMGLGDEYQTMSSKIDCLEESIMCESDVGLPMKHHYYFILRRILK